MVNINNFKLLFTSFLVLLAFSILSIGTASANEDLDEILPDGQEATVTITNDQTGEVTILDSEETKKNLKIKKGNSKKGEEKSANFEIFVPIEDPSLVTPFLVDGGLKTAGGVTATLNVNYDLRNSNQEIRLNRVYGTWKPSSNMYYLTNRQVNAHSGSVWGKSISRTPTSNIFGYSTGWGYNLFGGGDGSPRAWNSAKINISGMTATYTIKVEITFP